jgi:hypothetical protein
MPLSNDAVANGAIATDIAYFRDKVKRLVDIDSEEVETFLAQLRQYTS